MIDKPYFYFNFKEIHHLYYGIILGVVGLYFEWHILSVVGGLLFADDLIQHIVQGSDKTYKSPLHKLTLFLSL